MDDWEKLCGTSLHEKEDFYSQLNMETITETYYTHTKIFFKEFGTKNLGE